MNEYSNSTTHWALTATHSHGHVACIPPPTPSPGASAVFAMSPLQDMQFFTLTTHCPPTMFATTHSYDSNAPPPLPLPPSGALRNPLT
jgi:hypothetical protein